MHPLNAKNSRSEIRFINQQFAIKSEEREEKAKQ